jgi:hypothetical protein
MYPQGCGGSSPFFGTITFVIFTIQARSTYHEYWRLSLANLECNLTKQVVTSTGRQFCRAVSALSCAPGAAISP